MTIKLSTLPDGARFRIPGTGRAGTLLKANDCRARVRYDGEARHVELEDGGSFDAPGRALDISPNTEVEPLSGSGA